jgi:glycosyltransferase involved in cell wall biosynthesis
MAIQLSFCLDDPAVTARRTTIVCFSNLDWNYLRYRKQHLMSRLSRRFDVIYVNPPRALKARQPWRWNRVSRPGDHLWVLEPLVLPGVRNTPALKRVTDQLIARAIARIPVAPGPAIAWAYSPHALGLVDLIQPHFVVYDIADNYTTPGGAMVRDANERDEIARLEALEDRMLRRADLVLCVSEPLAARARRLHQDVHVIPNGCDFSAYHQVSAPPNLRPRIGYVGTIAPRVDDIVTLLIRSGGIPLDLVAA